MTEKKKIKSIGLTERQYRELETVRKAFEEDFEKRMSFGDIVSVLCMGYLTSRVVTQGQAERVLLKDVLDAQASEAEKT